MLETLAQQRVLPKLTVDKHTTHLVFFGGKDRAIPVDPPQKQQGAFHFSI